MIPLTWWDAPEVKEVADRLIPIYHPHLIEFEDRIRYCFRSRSQTEGTKDVWAKARLITGLNAYLAQPGQKGPDGSLFVLEVSHPVWTTITPAQREALTDHELLHMATETDDDGETVKVLRPHDVEEFDAIVARHGAWRPDIARFSNALAAGPASAPPAFDALICPSPNLIAALLESARKQDAGLFDALRRARGR